MEFMDEFTKKKLGTRTLYTHNVYDIYIYIYCILYVSHLHHHYIYINTILYYIILYYIIFTPPLYIPPLSPHFLKQAVIFEAPTQAIGRISQIKAGPLRGNMSWGLNQQQ